MILLLTFGFQLHKQNRLFDTNTTMLLYKAIDFRITSQSIVNYIKLESIKPRYKLNLVVPNEGSFAKYRKITYVWEPMP